MDYYKNAEDNAEVARLSYENGKYQVSISLSCLAVELYLKSVLGLVSHSIDLETSHDVINIYRCISKRYKSKTDLLPYLVQCRKYFNEARYPTSNSAVYTREFSEEFLDYVSAVKEFVDSQCKADIEDLADKFNKH